MMRDGINIEQKSIILVSFPYTDLSSSKKRPALIISNNKFNMSSKDVICCLITSNPGTYPHCVPITNKDMENGFLEFDSQIKPYRLFTVSKKLIYKILGKLNTKKANEVEKELSALTLIE